MAEGRTNGSCGPTGDRHRPYQKPWVRGTKECPPAPVVTVIGGGITGLSVAHELVERGFAVQVVEKERGTGTSDDFSQDEAAVGGIAKTQWAVLPTPTGAGPDIPIAEPVITWRPVPTSDEEKQSFLEHVVRAIDDRTTIRLSAVGYDDPMERLRTFFPDEKGDPRGPSVDEMLSNFDVEDDPKIEEKEVAFVVKRGDPNVVAGEHGYRFFPSFYRHLFDTMKRTPLFQLSKVDHRGETIQNDLEESERTVYDNLRPTTRMALGLGDGIPMAKFHRRRPTSLSELKETMDLMMSRLHFEESDLLRYQYKVLKWMTACTDRRDRWSTPDTFVQGTPMQSQEVRDQAPQGTWAHFVGADRYSEGFQDQLKASSQALVAMAEHEMDARTYGNISVQLLLDQLGMGEATDMTLNGPTTSAWFVPWKAYLESRGVRFYQGTLTGFKPVEPAGEGRAAEWEPKWAGGDDAVPDPNPLPRGPRDRSTPKATPAFNQLSADDPDDRITRPTYYVLATPLDWFFRWIQGVEEDAAVGDGDALALKADLLAELGKDDIKRWTPEHAERPFSTLWAWNAKLSTDAKKEVKDHGPFLPHIIGNQGEDASSPFRTFTGVQYYFASDVPFHQGHMYFPDTRWGLSAISQAQFWRRRDALGILSVDIGDMFSEDPSKKAGSETAPHMANAWAVSRQALVNEVWDQTAAVLASEMLPKPWRRGQNTTQEPDPYPLPLPLAAHVDDYLEYGTEEQPGQTLERNKAPFLINRPEDWWFRPGHEFPIPDRGPLVARRGGSRRYRAARVDHKPSMRRWFVAGPHTKTFTRMTTMEAANESARHVVNSLLNHLAARRDNGEDCTADGCWGAGCVMGTPAQIWDPEDHEHPDLRALKEIDQMLFDGKIAGKVRYNRRRHVQKGQGVGTPRDPGPKESAYEHMFDILGLEDLLEEILGDAEGGAEQMLLDAFEALATEEFGPYQNFGKDMARHASTHAIQRLVKLAETLRDSY